MTTPKRSEPSIVVGLKKRIVELSDSLRNQQKEITSLNQIIDEKNTVIGNKMIASGKLSNEIEAMKMVNNELLNKVAELEKALTGAKKVVSEQRDIIIEFQGANVAKRNLITVNVRWWDGYLEVFECSQVRQGAHILWMRLSNGRNRTVPLQEVRWFSRDPESHESSEPM